jgi:hypothetical protein
MLTHALADTGGQAAEELLILLGEREMRGATGMILKTELAAWLAARRDGEVAPPTDFVQSRWHDHDDAYRRFVTDLLTELEGDENVDHLKIVRDCHQRLETDRQRLRLSEALRTRTGGEGD